MIKRHSKDEFYVKAVRGGYFGVFDGYDNSLASLEHRMRKRKRFAKNRTS